MPKVAEGTGPATNETASTSVDSKHPSWNDRIDEWKLMRHAMRGTKAVKDEGTTYLPMPDGFASQSDGGTKLYNDYRMRAQFPEITSPTVMGMVGVIHRMEAQIEMPTAMEPLIERATATGLPLEAFHRMITWEIMTQGRYGILVDAPEEGADVPYLVGYSTESIINWSADRDFFVLDETDYVRNGFSWEWTGKWRVLQLKGESDGTDDGVTATGRPYEQVVYDDSRNAGAPIFPTSKGGKRLDKIPFTVVGTRNLSVDEINDPPLIGVARAAISIYQLSADYRHQLYNTGQETLFCFGFEKPPYVGAGVTVEVSEVSKDNHQPSAEYIGPSGEGIEAHKSAIEDERRSAASAGARLFDENAVSNESGDARRIRYSAETATLTSIAKSSAAGLEDALRNVALMMSLNPDDVTVTPNLSFIDVQLTPEEATKLVKLWQDDAISYQTLYENLQRGEIASSDRDHEEELKLIEEESEGEEDDPLAAGMLGPDGKPLQPQLPLQTPAPAPAPQRVPAEAE